MPIFRVFLYNRVLYVCSQSISTYRTYVDISILRVPLKKTVISDHFWLQQIYRYVYFQIIHICHSYISIYTQIISGHQPYVYIYRSSTHAAVIVLYRSVYSQIIYIYIYHRKTDMDCQVVTICLSYMFRLTLFNIHVHIFIIRSSLFNRTISK